LGPPQLAVKDYPPAIGSKLHSRRLVVVIKMFVTHMPFVTTFGRPRKAMMPSASRPPSG
jgi:hypothetical protein